MELPDDQLQKPQEKLGRLQYRIDYDFGQNIVSHSVFICSSGDLFRLLSYGSYGLLWSTVRTSPERLLSIGAFQLKKLQNFGTLR